MLGNPNPDPDPDPDPDPNPNPNPKPNPKPKPNPSPDPNQVTNFAYQMLKGYAALQRFTPKRDPRSWEVN